MASVHPIEISSSSTDSDSDSDLREIDNYKDESPARDTASSLNSRILPSWGSTSNSYSTGYKCYLLLRPTFFFFFRLLLFLVKDFIESLRPNIRLVSADTVKPSALMTNGNVHQRAGSNNFGRYGATHDFHTSHKPMKGMNPAALPQSSSNHKIYNLVEDVGTSEVNETDGKSYQMAAWSNASNKKNSMRENLIWEAGNNLSMSEKKGNRLLPPSLMAGPHPSATPFIISNDSFLHTGIGEEGSAGADESFVFQAAVQDLHQPKVEAFLPNGLLSVSLLRHQKIALAWMLNRESSGFCMGGILADDQMQIIKEAKSKRLCNNRTEALNLEDDDDQTNDGSGDCVALDDANQIENSGDSTIRSRASNSLKRFHSKRPTAGTLIVCPASVIRQWARELDEKVTDKARLDVLIYHGGNRTKNPTTLAKHNVVLTTYAIVTNEVPKQPLVDEDDDEQRDGERHEFSSALSLEKKRKRSSGYKKSKKGKKENDMSAFDSNYGTLAMVKWSRVVLDESQTIKNHRTQVARACCSLRAKRRWCLSGTPIQNSVDELFSYFRFLRYDPYDKYKVFASSIKGLISKDSVKGYKKLQVVLRNIMLRRTKGTMIDGKPIISLPPKIIQLRKVDFSLEERTFYDKLEADSRQQFKAYAAAGTVNQNYANILLMLLRLRQACDHPLLVKGFSSGPVRSNSDEVVGMLPKDMLDNLWNQLKNSVCKRCNDTPEEPTVTMCGHVFCYQCLSERLTGEDITCPANDCKQQLGADLVYSRSTLAKFCGSSGSDTSVLYELDNEARVLQSEYISSKIKCALEILKLHCISKKHKVKLGDVVRFDEDASCTSDLELNCDNRQSEKAIVFSQWTCMLDLVEMSLRNSHISYRRLDGTMSIAARDKAVKDFNSDPEVDVMLMSLKAGNLGLNMVAACRIILLDLWWNPTTEDQAIDRAHRIGQTRPVTVSRLTIKNTVEDRILALQEEKRKMVASAFGEDQSGGHATRLTVEDLRFLFEGSGTSRY
ncbi:helicase-like transcription factor CHR28 isoform X2 [Andrographis paniculata]|uniref:helicase-like transcription factor CHR28 isoform X2 n=1 Tax=Andrographis paniculata TaxID=175694 RepID=UPI0021E8284F|nr:helicase-like transcription factor CHR28 isoform X2 [Andrographis paniculata]